jgi:hypothetical protein
LDKDQQYILAVYSFYTHENECAYLQDAAACAIFYYLTKEGFFHYNLNELLVYDYKNYRCYIWEAKKFMADMYREKGDFEKAMDILGKYEGEEKSIYQTMKREIRRKNGKVFPLS